MRMLVPTRVNRMFETIVAIGLLTTKGLYTTSLIISQRAILCIAMISIQLSMMTSVVRHLGDR